MEIKLTANQVAEIVNSDERVKQAVVSLYLQRNTPSLTISDLLVGQQQSYKGGTSATSAPMSGGIGSSVGAGCGGAGSGGIGTLTTQQMMDACIADNAVAAGHDTYSTESAEPEIAEEDVQRHGKGRLKR